MKVIFGGQFESAILRTLSHNVAHTTSNQYYVSIYRTRSKEIFDRAATFLAIANESKMPMVDWSLRQSGIETNLTEGDLGIELIANGRSEWDAEIKLFSAIAISEGAFSPRAMQVISAVPRPSSTPPGWSIPTTNVNHIGGINFFSLHYLCRLLLQITCSRGSGSYLILSDDDQLVVKELGTFVRNSLLPTPFDLPDLTADAIFAGERFGGGLLNFSPRDGDSVAAVRSNPVIKKYAATVRDYINTERSDSALVEAMRDALLQREILANVRTVFEIESWTVKPLEYIPVLGEALHMFNDIRDLLTKWLQRKQSKKEWYLIGPKMQEITVEEYLKRKSNQ